jgi:hypothetical protein
VDLCFSNYLWPSPEVNGKVERSRRYRENLRAAAVVL